MAPTRWLKWFLRALVAALALPVAWLAYGGLAWRAPGDLLAISSTFAGVAGTLLGFVIAALAILAALLDRVLVANLRKTQHFGVLLRELYLAATLFLVVLVVALASLFLPPEWLRLGVAVSAAAQVYGIGLLVSAGRKFYLVVAHVA